MKGVVVSAYETLTIEDIEVPKEYVRQVRRADDLTKLLVACTHKALNLSGLKDSLDGERTGLFLGTSMGPLETNFRFLDTLFDDGEGQASPTIFSHSVHNAAAGYLSRIFKILGPSFTITSYAWPFLTALRQAWLAIDAETIDRAVVGTAELYSPVLGFASKQITNNNFNQYSSGAVCWIVEKETSSHSAEMAKLINLEINEEPCGGDIFLTREGEKFLCQDGLKDSGGLLSYIFSLTENMKYMKNIELKSKDVDWSVKAPFGEAKVEVSIM